MVNKITYSIQYKNGQWVIWKDIEKEKSISCIVIYKGTRKECQQRLEELKNGQRRI